MKKILILSFSVIRQDPRVMRQIRLLENSFQLTVAGFGSKPDGLMELIDLTRPPANLPTKLWWGLKLLFGFSENYYWQRAQIRLAQEQLTHQYFDFVIANDISALPLALQLSKGNPVLLDAHEYSPREFDDKWLWRFTLGRHYHDLCRRYLPKVEGMTTVCQGIADEYAKQYGVTSLVVHNAPINQGLPVRPPSPGKIRLVHHGAAIRSRHLETMIDVMKYLDNRFTIDFMLMESDKAYLSELHRRAEGDSRIRFIPAVPMVDICKKLNEYDIGIYLLPPVNFNHEHALPNKFFEFIQARLALAIGPSLEMTQLLKQFSCGVVAPSFAPEDLAETLSTISEEELLRYKTSADVAAKSLCFEASGNRLLDETKRLLAL